MFRQVRNSWFRVHSHPWTVADSCLVSSLAARKQVTKKLGDEILDLEDSYRALQKPLDPFSIALKSVLQGSEICMIVWISHLGSFDAPTEFNRLGWVMYATNWCSDNFFLSSLQNMSMWLKGTSSEMDPWNNQQLRLQRRHTVKPPA